MSMNFLRAKAVAVFVGLPVKKLLGNPLRLPLFCGNI